MTSCVSRSLMLVFPNPGRIYLGADSRHGWIASRSTKTLFEPAVSETITLH